MTNAYSVDDLLEFLDHAADRGLMPAASAQALAVASRSVLGVLTEPEKTDLSRLDVGALIKRFTNKRAKDFNPSSLKEYGRRVHRAVDLFLKWREDPANFTVKTRAASRRKNRSGASSDGGEGDAEPIPIPEQRTGTYHSSIPVRSGVVVTLLNVPHDLTRAEAERLAAFVKMLAVG